MELIGNGKMLVGLDGANILCVHAPSVSTPAFCSVLCDVPAKTFVKTDAVTGIEIRTAQTDLIQFRFTDFIHPERCVFVCRIESGDSFYLQLHFPSEAQTVYHCKYYTQNRVIVRLAKGTPYSTGLASTEEAFLSIILSGNIQLYENGKIRVGIGKSELTFVSGVLPDIAFDVYGRYNSDEIYESCCAASDRRISLKCRDVINRQSATGGIVKDAFTGECVIPEQRDALRTLLISRQNERARRIIDYLILIHQKNGFLPYGATANGDVIRRGAFPEAVSAAFAALCALDYWQQTQDNAYIKKIFNDIAQITLSQKSVIRKNHLPFNGCENWFNKTARAAALFEGSRHSDLLFIDSVDALSTLSSAIHKSLPCLESLKKRRNAVYDALSDYQRDGKTYRNTPVRYLSSERPKTLFFHCEYCAAKGRQYSERICVRNKFGHYVCSQCYADNPPEGLPGEQNFEENRTDYNNTI